MPYLFVYERKGNKFRFVEGLSFYNVNLSHNLHVYLGIRKKRSTFAVDILNKH